MENDPRRVTDGFITLEGGVDSGRAANLLQKNQLSWAVNATMRGGYIKPRLMWHKLISGGVMPTGRFQHGAFFNGAARPELMLVVDGHFYAISCDDFSFRDITPIMANPDGTNTTVPDPNVSTKLIGWSVNAELWWVYQDGDSRALIYNGASSRRAEAKAYEVPVGTVMEYAAGRLVVTLTDKTSFRVGDLIYNPDSGTPAYGFKDSVLRFTETRFANEGGDFITKTFGGPSNSGPITAMRQSVLLNTALGQGPMIVGTSNTIFSINLPFDRTTWKDTNSILQSVAMVGRGPMSQDATIIANGDIWYRAPDGARSHFLSVRNFGQWGNTIQSNEVRRSLDNDPQWLLQFGSAVQFDNRLLMTSQPIITNYGTYHQDVVSIDFDLISSLGQKLNPVWEGAWTDLKILKLIYGVVDNIERCFAFVLNDNNQIELWELLKNATTQDGNRITMAIETPRYAFGGLNVFGVAQPKSFNMNRLDGAQLFLESMEGQIDGILYYREDGNAPWRHWALFSVCASICDDSVPGYPSCIAPANLQRQTRTKLRFPTPPDLIDESNQKMTRTGFDFQARLEITGYCAITSFRLNAYTEEEFPYYEVGSTECVRVETCPPVGPCITPDEPHLEVVWVVDTGETFTWTLDVDPDLDFLLSYYDILTGIPVTVSIDKSLRTYHLPPLLFPHVYRAVIYARNNPSCVTASNQVTWGDFS